MRTDLKQDIANRLARAAVVALLGGLVGPSGAGADSIALSWTATGDDGSVGRASSYDVRYSETPVAGDTASWWTSATAIGSLPAPATSGTRESLIVTGLAPNRTYYFVLRAADEVPNWSGFSNVATKQTSGGAVVLATPTGFAASIVSGDVALGWDALAANRELGFRLYRKASTEAVPARMATLPLSVTSYSDTTAQGGFSYEYRLATYDDSTESVPAVVAISVPTGGIGTASHEIHGYPNPARGQVTLRFTLDASAAGGSTRITVFDLTGHRIRRLADQVMDPGEHNLAWNCRSDQGNGVAPGIYNIILDGPSGRSVTRLAIVP